MWGGLPVRRSARTTRSGCHGRRTPPSCWQAEADRSGMARPSVRAGSGSASWLGTKLIVAVPYLWLLGFFLVPFIIVVKISLSETAIAQPPYMPVLDVAAGGAGGPGFLRRGSVFHFHNNSRGGLFRFFPF